MVKSKSKSKDLVEKNNDYRKTVALLNSLAEKSKIKIGKSILNTFIINYSSDKRILEKLKLRREAFDERIVHILDTQGIPTQGIYDLLDSLWKDFFGEIEELLLSDEWISKILSITDKRQDIDDQWDLYVEYTVLSVKKGAHEFYKNVMKAS